MTDDAQTMKSTVEPVTLRGFQDLLPEQMIAHHAVIETIRGVFERFGFVPLDTPVLERLDALVGTGGEAINKELFRLESPEGEPIAMRFDLTVPFARLIAQCPERIKLPFRRYHVGPVFRADKPDPGRYRQFTQFDIDIAGTDSRAADAEVVAAMSQALRALGLSEGEFRIQINSRRLMDALLRGCGIDDAAVEKHVLRVVDKLQKVGLENVRAELGPGRVDESGDPIRGAGLGGDVIDRILAFIAVTGESRAAVLDAVRAALPESEITESALAEMHGLRESLDALDVSEGEATFEPSLARGLDYYTGPVFEATLPAAPQFGSVMGGGRYDGLVERFLDREIPAVGASIGIDRLVAALSALGKIEATPTMSQAIVLMMKGVAHAEGLAVARDLRAGGIAAEVYLGIGAKNMRKQLSHANDKGIPVAVILGPDEVAADQVSVKDLAEGKAQRADISDHESYKSKGKVGQQTIARDAMVQAVRDLLAG